MNTKYVSKRPPDRRLSMYGIKTSNGASVNLHHAKANKNDEFYTKYAPISDELAHYTAYFKDKVVYCNCDDHEKSNFVKYFRDNFDRLGLRGLISTHSPRANAPLAADPFGLGGSDRGRPAIRFDSLRMLRSQGGRPPAFAKLKEGGSFSSRECLDILEGCDIVVTNPPFSKFSRFYNAVRMSGKGFLIVAPLLSPSLEFVFPDILANRTWIGHHHDNLKFGTPDGDAGAATVWLTNLGKPVSQKMPKLKRRFAEGGYDRLYYMGHQSHGKNGAAGLGAINCDKVSDIPVGYKGLMAVPPTFFKFWDRRRYALCGKAATWAMVDKKNVFLRYIIQDLSAYKESMARRSLPV